VGQGEIREVRERARGDAPGLEVLGVTDPPRRARGERDAGAEPVLGEFLAVVRLAALRRVGAEPEEALAGVDVVLQARVDVEVGAEDAAVLVFAERLAFVFGVGGAPDEGRVLLRVVVEAIGRDGLEVLVVGQRRGVDLMDAVVTPSSGSRSARAT